MIARFKTLLATPVFSDPDKTRAASLVTTILWILIAVMILVPPITVFVSPADAGLIALFCLLLISLFAGSLLLVHRGHTSLVSLLMTLAFWAGITFSLLSYRGIRDLTIAGYFLTIVLAGLLLGGRAALVFGLICILTTLGVYYAEINGVIVVTVEPLPSSFQLMAIIVILGLVALLLRLAVNSIAEGFKQARRNAQALAKSNRELGASRHTLEAHSADLVRRTAQLQAAAEISRATTSILDPEQLLWRAVELIQERFGLYHVGLFLMDRSGEWAEYRAGAGAATRSILEEGLRLKMGGTSMIGWSTAHARTRVAQDVRMEPLYRSHPHVSEARSEAALPLIARGQVIGALSVQSDQVNAFDQATVVVLQTIADQIAVAIDNAHLFAEAQEALRATSRAYGELSRQDWSRLLRDRPGWGYRYAHKTITPIEGDWQPETLQVAQAGVSVLQGEDTLAVPLRSRDQVVGVLNFRRKDGGDKAWTAEEITLLEAMADQLGIALEGARLYRDTQRSAVRDRLTGEIAARMRETLDVDTVLQTAVREMGRTLGIARVEVRLGHGTASPETAANEAIPKLEKPE